MPGLAAVGVLQAFRQSGIEVTHVSGASAGAMIAALYAYGYSPDELAELAPTVNFRYLDVDWRAVLFKVMFIRPQVEGWLKGERLRKLMLEMTQGAAMDTLRIPCGITATDLQQGQTFVFSSVPVADYAHTTEASIADAVRASFAIPLLFQPVRLNGRLLTDGGVTANCPVRVCRSLGAERVIAVDPITPLLAKEPEPPLYIFKTLNRLINLSLKVQMEHEHRAADYTLQPDIGDVGAFDFRKGTLCMEAGYEAAMANMAGIKAVLSSSEQPHI